MLKFKLTAENYEKLNDVEKTFYKAGDDGYQLQVEGATDKDKLDEFRSRNVELLKIQEKYKDIDLDEVAELQEQKRKLLDKKFIDEKDFDGLVNSRTNVITQDFQSKLDALTAQLNDSQNNHLSLVSKHEIDGAINTALVKHKISPDAHGAVMAQVQSKFSIDNGVAVAKDGDKILSGKAGNLTIDEFVETMPEIFKIQSNGGRANGGGGDGGRQSTNNQSGVSQISEGLKALGKN